MSMRDDMMDGGSDSDSDDSPSPLYSERIERTSSGSSRFSLNMFGGDNFPMHFGGGSSKRRGGVGSGARDAKSRRREDSYGSGVGRRSGQSSSFQFDQRDTGSSLRQKDELVDSSQVDTLRAQFGDPFDDRIFNTSK
ncbi:hypothetical protein FOMPIDRAFT_1051514 [Fomitopsis schrenkii]|uniref:Uncharacterized protein n=1 Tax=Fomitopsis schrenkii TaxID=2126942 RepID=S8E503_FOMSC|nr:hypothetical protein FOMPIDRAFT_1051514 [Fomitopsis schrenkii]